MSWGRRTTPNLTASWVSSVSALGWRLVPIYLGRQAPCSTRKYRFTASSAASWGTSDAGDAVTRARALGMLPGAPSKDPASPGATKGQLLSPGSRGLGTGLALRVERRRRGTRERCRARYLALGVRIMSHTTSTPDLRWNLEDTLRRNRSPQRRQRVPAISDRARPALPARTSATTI